MDVNNISFRAQLPSILGAIARSRFVSFDLELSGIRGKSTRQSRPDGRGDGKQTLQQRYEETKSAAEKYQIIQLGLTCVEEDLDRGVYVTRPYNFYVNPVPDKGCDIERDFTYQSSAVEFLLSVNFRMDSPFLEGVSYLSRQEEAEVRSNEVARQSKSHFKDIFIRDDDVESLAFVSRVREDIQQWASVENPKPPSLVVANSQADHNGRGLNGYQRRLVHQLVRAEFPKLVSFSRSDVMQILPYDQEREDAIFQRRMTRFNEMLTRQIGLRWIAEAMCPDVDSVLPSQLAAPNASGNLAAVTPWVHPPLELPLDESAATNDPFHEALESLRARRTVIVGHNVFLDLIYFYSCFFGPLPDRVEEFQRIISELLPLVVDTKYLADKIKDNSPLYRSSLEDIDQELSVLQFPIIETPPEHGKYLSNSPAHEAGFDSFLTARILIRLSASIEKEMGRDLSPGSDEDAYYSASESGGTPLPLRERGNIELNGHPDWTHRGRTNTQIRASPLKLPADQFELAHKNAYELLDELSIDDVPKLEPAPLARPNHTMMPLATSTFWSRYGNKLRVNGTVEGVCIIR